MRYLYVSHAELWTRLDLDWTFFTDTAGHGDYISNHTQRGMHVRPAPRAAYHIIGELSRPLPCACVTLLCSACACSHQR